MEPFFIRCETCRARLRVRDERFLGQVQSCPKCGSMVQIIAPAAIVVPQENTPVSGPGGAVAGSTGLAAVLQTPIALWSAVGAFVVVVGGLVGMMALGGEDEVAVAPSMRAAVDMAHSIAPQEIVEPAPAPVVEEPAFVESPQIDEAAPTVAFLPIEPAANNESEAIARPTPTDTAQNSPAPPTRTLTLEVVEPKPNSEAVSAATSEPPAAYADVPEVESKLPVEVDPPLLPERPDRLTNIDDQLSMSFETIELPAMPIGEFVNLISEMSAVPIRLDTKVLGDAGLSTKTKVVVQGGDVTLGDLLARVLKEHHLTCVERDGELIVVRAKQ